MTDVLNLKRRLGGLSLTAKAVLITMAVGLVSWFLAGWYQSYTLKDLYRTHLMKQLKADVFEGRTRIHKGFNSFFKLGKLIVTDINFSSYISAEESKWNSGAPRGIKIHRQPPPWYPEASLLSLFPNARYALLIEPKGKIREIYVRNYADYPEFLRHPMESIPQMRWNSNFLTTIDGKPYAITSDTLADASGNARAILLLVTPIDDEFIFVAMMPETRDLVALVDGISSVVIASSDQKLIKPGTKLNSFEDRYLVVGESFFDYGNSDLLIRFAAFIPKERIQEMTESFTSKERFKRAASIFVVISIFSILMVRISRRISNVTHRIEDFSSRALEGKPVEPLNGDELVKLENQFHNLTETVIDRTTELKEKELSYRTLAENLPGIAFRLFLCGERKMQFFNAMLEPMTGYKESELGAGDLYPMESLMLPEDCETVLATIIRAIEERTPFEVEYRIRLKDGGVMYCVERGKPIYDDSGKPSHIDGIIIDATERKKAAEALMLTQFTLDSAADPVFWISSDARIIYVNDAACKSLGYSMEELLSMSVQDIDTHYPADRWSRQWERVMKRGHVVFETEHRAKDGRVFPVEITANYIKYVGGEYHCVFARDMTERKRAEEALKKSEERFKILFEYAPDAYFLIDLNGKFVDMNKAAVEMSGYAKEELLGGDLFEMKLLSSKDLGKATSLSSRFITGEPAGPEEFIVTRKDGSRTSVEVSTYPVVVDDRTLVLSIARDISERVQAEMKLREGKQFLSNILESIQDGLCIVGMDNVLVMANRTMERWFGHRGAIEGRKCFEVIRGRDEVCNQCPAAETMRTGQGSFDTVAFRRPSGAKGWLDIYTFPLRAMESGDIVGVILYLRDVTDRVAFQAEAARTSQLASLGELAAGVAHEINNPINGIINYAQILANKLPEGREGEISRRIIKEGDRVSEIVKSLLSFSRDESGWKIAESVNNMLAEVLSLIGSQLRKEGIRLTYDVKPDLPEVYVNRQQVEQVFLNIINNSRYALKQKYSTTDDDKVLDIWAEAVSFSGTYYVRVTFLDKGVGISKFTLDKVSSPFFTTKPRGSGTGLGLSISQSIVNNHGGRLSISSVEGEFTQVTVDLPQWRERER